MTTDHAPRHGRQYVAIYLRISKVDARAVVPAGASPAEADAARLRAALTSLERQRTNCRRVAAERWPTLTVVEYVDDGVSASRARSQRRRAGLASMSEALRAGRVAAVVIDTLDRLTRDRGAASMWDLAAVAEDAGAVIVGASQDIDLTTSSGELSASIMAAAARYEAKRMGERIRAANVLRHSWGMEAAGGPAIIGQRRTEDGGVEPDPIMGPIVVDAIARLTDGRATISGLVAEFEARDDVPPPPYGGRWTHRTLSMLWRRPSLAGMVPADGDVLRGADGLPVLRDGALITMEQWHALQDAVDARSKSRAPLRRPRPLPLLHGLARCPNGHRLYLLRIAARSTKAARQDYRCQAIACDARTGIAEGRLDAYVVGLFLAEVGGEPEIEAVTVERGGDPARLTAIRRDLAAARTGREAAERARDRDKARDFGRRVEALLDAEDAAADDAILGRYVVARETGRTLAEALAAAQDAGDVEGARAVLALHVEAVTVTAAGRGRGDVPLTERVAVRWLPGGGEAEGEGPES